MMILLGARGGSGARGGYSSGAPLP